MAATLEVESALTDRYQTTVSETVRRPLKLGERDQIHYTIRPGGEVVLSRLEIAEEDDPVLGRFLDFLSRDIANHPERLQTVDASLVQRIHSTSRAEYRVFRKMLESGHPPNDWNQLLAEARIEGHRQQRIGAGVAQVQP